MWAEIGELGLSTLHMPWNNAPYEMEQMAFLTRKYSFTSGAPH